MSTVAKRPDHMTPEERLTRILSLERRVSDLERDKEWAERDAASVRHWAEEAWKEVRHLEAMCTRHWDEKNEYRKAAGLEPLPKMVPIAKFDHQTREWVPLPTGDQQS